MEYGLDESFLHYAFEIIADIALGVFLGVLVNMFTNFIAEIFKLPRLAKIAVQLALIICVLYVMKIDSKYLYKSWKGQTSYGIIFTAVFLAVQRNLITFFQDIYDEEANNFRNLFAEK